MEVPFINEYRFENAFGSFILHKILFAIKNVHNFKNIPFEYIYTFYKCIQLLQVYIHFKNVYTFEY